MKRISLRALLVGVSIVAVVFGILNWTGFWKDGVWYVETINEQDAGTWHGETSEGEAIGGALWTCVAICRDGYHTRTFTLTDEYTGMGGFPVLPLRKGDRFRVIKNPQQSKETNAIVLPDGTAIRKVPAAHFGCSR